MSPLRTLLTSHMLTLAFVATAGVFGMPDGPSAFAGKAFGASGRRAIVLDVNVAGNGIPHANSDAEKIASLLHDRFDFDVKHKQSVAPNSLANETWHLVNGVKEATEQVVVYFRGYLRVEKNSAWLTGVDSHGRRTVGNSFDVNQLVNQLHAIKKCSLATILLDVVSEDSQLVIEAALKSAIANAGSGETPVAILVASSSESNPTWHEVAQSRMSYWLVDGLRGAAISRARPTASFAPGVLLEELVEHLKFELAGHTNLSFVTSSRASISAVVTPTRVKTLDELISDLATRMAAQLKKSQIKAVVIPDFEV